jgi:hypothetical protein
LLSRINSPYGTSKKANVKLTQIGTMQVTRTIREGEELLVSYGSGYAYGR